MGTHRVQPTDPFESSTEVEGTVLHRDKLVARKLALLCVVMTLAFSAAGVAYANGWQPTVNPIAKWLTYLLPLLFVFVGLTRTVVRTTVTTREVRVQWGLWGPRIPLERIAAVRVWDGSKRPEGGTHIYLPAGANGIYLEWTDEGGSKNGIIGSEDPAALVAAIERARQSAMQRIDAAIDTDAGALERANEEAEQAEAEADPSAAAARGAERPRSRQSDD